MKDRIIIKNGKLLTMDENKQADWIVVEGEKILAVGKGEEYKAYETQGCRIIDAKASSVLPGFIDNHIHIVKTALAESYIDLSNVVNFEELYHCLKEVAISSNSKALIARGLDVDKLEEKTYPNRNFLDKCCNDKPVAIYSADYHVLMLNTYGIMYYKIPFSLPGLNVDPMGVPTGILEKQAGSYLDDKIASELSYEEIDEAVESIIPKLLSYGLTTAAAAEGGNIRNNFLRDYECEFMIDYISKYPIALKLYYQTTDTEYVAEKGLAQIGGALYVDGTISSRTAAISFDYSDDEGNKGLVCFEEEYLEALAKRCCEKNLQLSLDVIGDAAIEKVLEAFGKVDEIYGIRDRRFRIEHGELITLDQMKRAAELGVVLSVQPYYEMIWGHRGEMYEVRLGSHYGETNRYREILDEGIILCGGSDCMVTPPNPLEGIWAAVNHPVKENRVSVEEAVNMYTYNGAYAMFMEDTIGSLTPGKTADIVILDGDITAVDPSDINKLQVVTTVKSGEILFEGSLC